MILLPFFFGKFLRTCFFLVPTGFLMMTAIQADETTSLYGKESSSEAALMGMFYDLKQDQYHQRSAMDTPTYEKIIDEFLQKHWDESVLNRYYHASRPLFTTQIFVPIIDASAGPTAFGVAKTVEPNYYVVHYKGQVAAPETGTYRFVGYGDNVLIAAVGGETVLVGNRADIQLPTFSWQSHGEGSKGYPDANLINGAWFDLRAGEAVDLDVLIGESSGGSSAFFLMIEKQGAHYETDSAGKPILPVFQVAPYATPAVADGAGPKIAQTPSVWKGLQ